MANVPSSIREELRDEYKLVLNRFDDFDKRSLQVKTWIAAAAVLAAVNWKVPHDSMILVGICIVVLVTWFTDASLCAYADAEGYRLVQLEKFFREGIPDSTVPFQIAFNAHRHFGISGTPQTQRVPGQPDLNPKWREFWLRL